MRFMKTLIWVDDYRPEPALHGGFLGKDLDNIIVCKTFRCRPDYSRGSRRWRQA